MSQTKVVVVNFFTLVDLEPRRTLDIFASVFVPGDIELGFFVVAQNFGCHEWTDVHAHSVVQVGVPANRHFVY